MNEMFIFGVIDNGILIVSMLVMAGIGGRCKRSMRTPSWINPTTMAILGGYLGNAASDGAGAIPMGWTATYSVVLGCLAVGVAFLIPGVWKRISNA